MKHLKPVNKKAEHIVSNTANVAPSANEVVAMQTVVSCTGTTVPAGKSTCSVACPDSASQWNQTFTAALIPAGGRPRFPT